MARLGIPCKRDSWEHLSHPTRHGIAGRKTASYGFGTGTLGESKAGVGVNWTGLGFPDAGILGDVSTS